MANRQIDRTQSHLMPPSCYDRAISIHTFESSPSPSCTDAQDNNRSSIAKPTFRFSVASVSEDGHSTCRSCLRAEDGACTYYTHEILAQYANITPTMKQAATSPSMNSVGQSCDNCRPSMQTHRSAPTLQIRPPTDELEYKHDYLSTQACSSSNYTSTDVFSESLTARTHWTTRSTIPTRPHSTVSTGSPMNVTLPSNPYNDEMQRASLAPRRITHTVGMPSESALSTPLSKCEVRGHDSSVPETVDAAGGLPTLPATTYQSPTRSEKLRRPAANNDSLTSEFDTALLFPKPPTDVRESYSEPQKTSMNHPHFPLLWGSYSAEIIISPRTDTRASPSVSKKSTRRHASSDSIPPVPPIPPEHQLLKPPPTQRHFKTTPSHTPPDLATKQHTRDILQLLNSDNVSLLTTTISRSGTHSKRTSYSVGKSSLKRPASAQSKISDVSAVRRPYRSPLTNPLHMHPTPTSQATPFSGLSPRYDTALVESLPGTLGFTPPSQPKRRAPPPFPPRKSSRQVPITSPASSATVPMHHPYSWLLVLAGFLSMFATSGLQASFGIFIAFYHAILLPSSSLSSIAWIGSLQLFLLFTLRQSVSYLIARGHFRVFTTAGAALMITGLLVTSWCDRLWQLVLVQSILAGTGMGLLFSGSVACLLDWSETYSSRALAVAAAGSATGMMVYTAMFIFLVLAIGFAWTMRVLALVTLLVVLLPVAVLGRRLPRDDRTRPERKAESKCDEGISRSDLAGPAFLCLTLGTFAAFCGVYLFFTYLPIYALEVLHVSGLKAASLLIVLGAGTLMGTLIPALMPDPYSRLWSTMIPSCLLMAAFSVAWIWSTSDGALFAVAAVYGLSAGNVFALNSSTVSSVDFDRRPCERTMQPRLKGNKDRVDDLERVDSEETITEERNRRLPSGHGKDGAKQGLTFFAIAVACLTGGPIGGALVREDKGDSAYLRTQVFAACSMLSAAVLLSASRLLRVRSEVRRV